MKNGSTWVNALGSAIIAALTGALVMWGSLAALSSNVEALSNQIDGITRTLERHDDRIRDLEIGRSFR